MAPQASADEQAGAGSGLPDLSSLSLSSRTVHADDHISVHRAVAPALHVSTTFRYSDDPDQLLGWGNVDVSETPEKKSETFIARREYVKRFEKLTICSFLFFDKARCAEGLSHLLARLQSQHYPS